MTHKKSIILAFFAATLAAATTYTFSACDDDNETTGQLKFAQQRLDMTVGEAKENIVYEGVPPYAPWYNKKSCFYNSHFSMIQVQYLDN